MFGFFSKNDSPSIKVKKGVLPKLSNISIVSNELPFINNYSKYICISKENILNLEETSTYKYNAKESLYLDIYNYNQNIIHWVDYYTTHNYTIIINLNGIDIKDYPIDIISDIVAFSGNLIILVEINDFTIDNLKISLSDVDNIILNKNIDSIHLAHLDIPNIEHEEYIIIKGA